MGCIAMATSEFRSAFLTLEERDPAVIATITRPQLSEEENIEVFGKDLLDLVDQYGFRQIVVSLQHVTYITSAALGKLITLHRKLHRKAGRLIVCGAFDSVKDVLQASHLNSYFTIADDVPAALAQMK
jgi:anti-sigma B factor antagonist